MNEYRALAVFGRLGSHKSLHGIFVVVLVMVMAISCSSEAEITQTESPSAEPATTSTQVAKPATPTVVPLFTATPKPDPVREPTPVADRIPTVVPATQISEPTVEPTPILASMNVEESMIRSCSLGRYGQGGEGFGTAPAPTPTPSPQGDRDASEVRSGKLQYLASVFSMARNYYDLNNEFVRLWEFAEQERQQIALLFVLGNRISWLCGALSLVEPPPELLGEHLLLSESLRVRHVWISLAIDQIRCCETARVPELEVGHASVSLLPGKAWEEMIELQESVDWSPEVAQPGLILNPIFNMSLEPSSKVLLSRNSLDLVLIYDSGILVDFTPTSLGPKEWRFGDAIRIRRVRNTSGKPAFSYAEDNSQIFLGGGEIESITSADHVTGDAAEIIVTFSEIDWVSDVWLFNSGEFIYFVEVGCHNRNSTACKSLTNVRATLKFIDS